MIKACEVPKVEFITTPEGRPKSVIVSIEDWKRINETLKIMSSKDLMASIRQAKKELSGRTKLLSFNEVFDNL